MQMGPDGGFGQMGTILHGAQAAQSYWSSLTQKTDALRSQASRLRYYFDVNNLYVLNKLKILLFPWIHKAWARQRSGGFGATGAAEPLPPREDINAPDLYIPTMAFTTYILLIGLLMGFNNAFHPEVLGVTASSGLVVLALEVILVRLSFMALSVRSVDTIDLVAVCAYKYVGICATAILGLVLGRAAYWIALIALSVGNGFFLLRTLHAYMQASVISAGAVGDSRHNHVLLVLAVAQPAIYWFLGVNHLLAWA